MRTITSQVFFVAVLGAFSLACGGQVGVAAAVDRSGDADVGEEPCSSDEKAQLWNYANTQGVAPGQGIAGLYPSGSGTNNVTLGEAEQALCTADDLTGVVDAPPGQAVAGWGPADVLLMYYDPTTKIASALTAAIGFEGSFNVGCLDGDFYQIALGAPITTDGEPFAIDQSDAAAVAAAADAIYRATICTFAEDSPTDPVGVTCEMSGKCVVSTSPTLTMHLVTGLNFSLTFGGGTQTAPVVSAMTQAYPVSM